MAVFPRSHAPRGNAVRDAPRPRAGPKAATQSVEDGIPTRSVGTRVGRLLPVVVISEDSLSSRAMEGDPTSRSSLGR